jgi:Telomeric single stranded DNA binding POT1/CDC13
MNKKELKEIEKEVTLGSMANDSTKRDKHLSWGVIIDVSEPFRYENKDEYVVKIKIIDPTFNMKAYIENEEIKFHKFVTVHVYSGFINKCPKIKNVGDIIRLRRFNVSFFF